MISNSIPIPNRSRQPDGSLRGDVEGLFPAGIQVSIHNPGLCKALLILVTKYDIGIAVAVNVHGLEIFGFDDFNGEDVARLAAVLVGRSVFVDNRGNGIGVYGAFEFVELLDRKLNVVEFNTTLPYVSSRYLE